MEPWLELFARANFRRSADTAHDLKTPLNVAVLNLELLRMRLRKLIESGEDDRIENYTQAIETELRRLGRIFDAFFLLSTPPKNDETPGLVDMTVICGDLGLAPAGTSLPAYVAGHESRIRQACRLLLEGASKVLGGTDTQMSTSSDGQNYVVSIDGRPADGDFELTRIFKFYYTDPEGNPDLSLAAARLIAETYGGELNAVEESGKVSFRLSFPLGAR